MTIVKNLFFLTVLGLAVGAQISASEPENKYLDFIDHLSDTHNVTYKQDAAWMREQFIKSDTTTEQLKDIALSSKPLLEKINAIEEIKTKETTPKITEGYFSNVSTMAKAAAALMVTAGIISYLYFTRPWITSAEQ
jgi:hypothetical protein